MAIDDFGGTVLGKKIELISADVLNKPDVAVAIASRWYDAEHVDAILGAGAFVATRSCLNNGRIRCLISRSDAAHNPSVSSIDAARAHDLRIMVAHRFRNLQKRQL